MKTPQPYCSNSVLFDLYAKLSSFSLHLLLLPSSLLSFFPFVLFFFLRRTNRKIKRIVKNKFKKQGLLVPNGWVTLTHINHWLNMKLYKTLLNSLYKSFYVSHHCWFYKNAFKFQWSFSFDLSMLRILYSRHLKGKHAA